MKMLDPQRLAELAQQAKLTDNHDGAGLFSIECYDFEEQITEFARLVIEEVLKGLV